MRFCERRVSGCAVFLALAACSSDDGGSVFGGSSTGTGAGAGGAGHGGSISVGSTGAQGGTGATTTGNGGAPTAASVGGGPDFEPEVACDGSVCQDATPICCVPAEGAPSCAPYQGAESCGEGPAIAMACDELTDCLAGQVCCVDLGAGNGGVYTCGYAPCATHEACVPGGLCGQPNFVCVDDPQQASGASCVPG